MDIDVQNEGTVVLIRPVSSAGRAWLDENVESEPWQWLGPSLAVDWRFANALVEGMLDSGLEVTSDP